MITIAKWWSMWRVKKQCLIITRKGGELYVDHRNGSANCENFIKENRESGKKDRRDFEKIIETFKKWIKLTF